MATLKVELVAADRTVFVGEAKRVSARGIEGDLGILPRHQPLMTVLAPGEVRIETVEGSPLVSQVEGGFMSVDDDKVTIVTERVTTA